MMYLISVNDNPAFATNDKVVKVNYIIAKETIEIVIRKHCWELWKPKTCIEKVLVRHSLSELKDNDIICIQESEYSDRKFINGEFVRL